MLGRTSLVTQSWNFWACCVRLRRTILYRPDSASRDTVETCFPNNTPNDSLWSFRVPEISRQIGHISQDAHQY